MWRKKPRGSGNQVARAALDIASAIDRNTAEVKSARPREMITGIVTVIAAVAAACSAWFAGSQASSLAAQIEQSNEMLDAQTLGAVSVSGQGATVSITNRSGVPFESVGVWVIAEDQENQLLEVLGEAVGLPSCSTLEIDLSEQLGAAVIAESMTAIRLPSDAWYLITAGGRTEPIDYTGSEARPALQNSDFYVASADTYWEGADGWDEIVLDDVIVAGAPRTGWSPAQAELLAIDCAS